MHGGPVKHWFLVDYEILRTYFFLRAVSHTCNPLTWKAGAGGLLQVELRPTQHGLQYKTLSQNNKTKKVHIS